MCGWYQYTPGSGKLIRYPKAAAHLDGVLGVVGAVEPVVQPQPVPVHGGLQVPVVGGVHHHLGALPDAERGPGDGPVVGQHPDRGVTDLLGHRRDAQVEDGTVGQLNRRGRNAAGKAGDVGAERILPG